MMKNFLVLHSIPNQYFLNSHTLIRLKTWQALVWANGRVHSMDITTRVRVDMDGAMHEWAHICLSLFALFSTGNFWTKLSFMSGLCDVDGELIGQIFVSLN
jgi:methionine salvage enolase-phosphatase E1